MRARCHPWQPLHRRRVLPVFILRILNVLARAGIDRACVDVKTDNDAEFIGNVTASLFTCLIEAMGAQHLTRPATKPNGLTSKMLVYASEPNSTAANDASLARPAWPCKANADQALYQACEVLV